MDAIELSLEILGLGPDATPQDIKQAYRDLVKVWHPDRFPNDSTVRRKAEEKLKDINTAFESLQGYDPASRVRSSSPHGNPSARATPAQDRPRYYESYRDKLYCRFLDLPTWARWEIGIIVVITLFLVIPAVQDAWGEKRFVGAFAEAFVAHALYKIGLIVTLFLGASPGLWIADTSGRDWLGWVVGLPIFLAVVFIYFWISEHIPGVGWRFKELMESQ